jgi:ribose transport system permease protein
MTNKALNPQDADVRPEPAPLASRGFDFAYWWDRVGILVVLIALVALMIVIAPNFASVNNLLNIARSISINAILAAGMTFVILAAGIDLSVGSILAVAGVSSVMAGMAGLPAPIAILVGVLTGAAAGLINGMLSAYLALAAFIVTLGTMTFLRGLAYTMTDGQPIVSNTLNFRDVGNGYLAGIPVPVVIMVIVYVAAWFVLERTRYGRHIYAGVIFSARVVSAQPTAGTGYELDAIAAVVLGGTSLIGGRGRIYGTLIGSIILGVLSTGLILMNVQFFTQLLIKGLVIILAVAIDSLKQRTLRLPWTKALTAQTHA